TKEMNEVFDGAIGIDLGTTFSCVAVLLNDQVQVIPNDQGNRTTPSCVAFHADDVLVGDAAKNLVARGAPGIVYDAKRMIGCRFSEKSIQEDSRRWPFTVKAGEQDRVLIEVDFKGEKLSLSPEQISSKVLEYLKHCAEKYIGKRVTKAVITVPAYFNDAQRDRTKAAAAIAGLEVLRIVNEPTAAALCYGLGIGSGTGEQQGKEKAIDVVVFDFGGGTFDVSVITIDAGSFAVRATAGDTHLGGQDVDSNLLKYVADNLMAQHNINIHENTRQLAKLRAACEKTKRALSHSTSEELVMDGLLPGGDEYTINISRAKLEELNAKLFDQCIAVVQKALKDAAITPEEIAEVILVGGSSRIPKLQEKLTALFKGKKLCGAVNPDEAVAIGAAVQGSILSSSPEQQSAKTADVVLMDVVPLSIGVEVDNGKFDVIIPRNTTIPYKAVKEYSTVEDYQQDVDIVVYEGERPLTKHNHKLGEFSLEGITRAKKGVPTINVTFSVDADGLLTITATEAAAGKSKSLTVQNSERLSDEEMSQMIEMAKKFQKEDSLQVVKEDTRHTLEGLFQEINTSLATMKQPPSAKLQKRVKFLPHGEDWVREKLDHYESVREINEKADKIKHLCDKALKRARRESSASPSKRLKTEEESESENSNDSDG
ncbi:heat shock 70kDa protein 1/8, partial [Angomonas deanei]